MTVKNVKFFCLCERPKGARQSLVRKTDRKKKIPLIDKLNLDWRGLVTDW